MIVVFDFDGTLASSFDLVNICLFKVLEENNIQFSKEDLNPYYGPTEEGMIYHILKNDDKSNFKKYIKYYKELHNTYLKELNPYALDLLKHLKERSIKTCLLTGRSKETTEISLDYFKIKDYFLKIYTGNTVEAIKDINLKKLMKDFNVNNEEIIYIGDSKKDIEQCNSVNVKILSINFDKKRYKYLKELNPLTFSNFKDLEDYLLK